MKHVDIYADGACSGNPGPGGWGTILKYDEHIRELQGGDCLTTNNRMELTAVIRGLQALKEPCEVEIYTDSQYIVNAFKDRRIDNWQKNNWVNASKKPVKNIDLWKTLLGLTAIHKCSFTWVKGHNGHPENERCDKLAVFQRDLHSTQ